MTKDFDYKSQQQKLENIIESMQSGNLTIDESLREYKEAEQIIKTLEKYLKSAENEITKIKGK